MYESIDYQVPVDLVQFYFSFPIGDLVSHFIALPPIELQSRFLPKTQFFIKNITTDHEPTNHHGYISSTFLYPRNYSNVLLFWPDTKANLTSLKELLSFSPDSSKNNAQKKTAIATAGPASPGRSITAVAVCAGSSMRYRAGLCSTNSGIGAGFWQIRAAQQRGSSFRG